MSSEKKIFCGDTVDDDLPLDMQTKSLGDIKKILFYVKDLIAVISFKARKSILNLNETYQRSRKKVDISYSTVSCGNQFWVSFRC